MTLDTMSSLSSLTLAQVDAAPATGASPMGGMIWMLLLIVGFWFLIIAPQRKKQKQHDKMLTELKNGDDIVTLGGIYGTIANVKNDRIVVKIADGVRIEVTKNSISGLAQDSVEKK